MSKNSDSEVDYSSTLEKKASIENEELRKKIEELESQIVEKDKENFELQKKSTNYNYGSILEDLPIETVLEILSYLSNHDILRNVAQVSKKFHKITQDPFLIRKIEVNNWKWYQSSELQEEKKLE